jgi:hypothetical protein
MQRRSRRFTTILLVATALLSLAAMSRAQIASPQGDSAGAHLASLQGIVIKDPGSEPIKKAVIELIAESQSDGANYTAVSGADGSFQIENIVPGRYRFFVERTGYQETDKNHRATDGHLLSLRAGQEVKDFIIRLQSAAVVEGRVTDEDGDPMPEAQVAVLHQTYVAGRSHWEQAGAERTNDLGEYRIAGLRAGNYFVSVTPPPDFRSLIEANGSAANPVPAIPDKAHSTYQTNYYPGTRDREQAAPIQLHAGDDFSANFSLTPSPSLIIRGSVGNLPPGLTATITLQSRDSVVMNGAEMHKDGTFEIRDVAPGSYTILARVDNAQSPMTARQSLQLASTNVEGIRLSPQVGGTIRGRLRLETSSATRQDASQLFLLLLSGDDEDDAYSAFHLGDNSATLAQVHQDGSFEWKDVPAGRYVVQISDASAMPDLFLKSVLAGGHDVSESSFRVSSGGTVLDLVASDSGAAIEGVVTNSKSEPAPDALVVAVPEERFRSHPERYRKSDSDQSGRFALRGLPPGDYILFAWQDMDGEAYLNPEFLKVYESQGKPLHIKAGEHASVQLNVLPASEDEP